MAQPNAALPQVVDPERLADLIRLLTVRGPLGVLNVADVVVPVVSLGDVVERTITVLQPAFRASDFFSVGTVTGGAAGTILADTGPLPAGTYDVIITVNPNQTAPGDLSTFDHRNAANTANQMTWTLLVGSELSLLRTVHLAIVMGLNERLRLVIAMNMIAPARIVGGIWARIRG